MFLLILNFLISYQRRGLPFSELVPILIDGHSTFPRNLDPFGAVAPCALAKHKVWNILGICFANTFAITWIFVHPNKLQLDESDLSNIKLRLLLTLLSMAPEFMILWAFKQWRGAVKKWKMTDRVLSDLAPCITCEDAPCTEPFTMTHVDLLRMGGFRVVCTEEESLGWSAPLTLSEIARLLRVSPTDGSGAVNSSINSTSTNTHYSERGDHLSIPPESLFDKLTIPEAQRDPLYRSSFEFPGWSRRNIVFRTLEGSLLHRLPQRRMSCWKTLQNSMKIYPFTIHYAIQVLDFLETVTLPLPYTTSTFNRIHHESFLRQTNDWVTWTALEAIGRHDNIKSSLLEVLSHVETLVAYTDEIPLARVWSQLLRECLVYDHDDMKQVVEEILALGDKAIEHAMRLTTEERNSLMNVLQTLIDLQVTNHRMCEKFLQKLVRRSGELPGYLIIRDVEKIGTNPVEGGGFSDVWKGSMRGTLVAMKVLRIFNVTEEERNRIHMDYCNESMLWRQLKHRNILPFYGVAVDVLSPQLAMISPWLENGCVISYLKKNPSIDRRHILTEIATGLQYLHTLKPSVIHGDLRGANVLINDKGRPQLADFGLAQFFDSQASSPRGGTLRWQAPELLSSNNSNGTGTSCQVTTYSDVYAFAILCWEIFTLDVPYAGLRDGDVVRVVLDKERPPRLAARTRKIGLSHRLWKLIVSGWDHDPQNRPNMDIVVQKLMAGMTISIEYNFQPSGLDLQKIDVFIIPDELSSIHKNRFTLVK